MRFCEATWAPAKPQTMTTTSSSTPTSPQRISIPRLVRTRPSASGSGRKRSSSNRGFVQRVASAANDTTMTTAAPQLNSQIGMGRSARPVSPCAKAEPGIASASAALTTTRMSISYECSRSGTLGGL